MRCMTAQRSGAPLFPTSPSARNGAFILLITLVCSTRLCVAPRGRFCVSCYNDHGNGLGWFLSLFFFVILVLKVIIPPLFHSPANGTFGKIPVTPTVPNFSLSEDKEHLLGASLGTMLSQRPRDTFFCSILKTHPVPDSQFSSGSKL